MAIKVRMETPIAFGLTLTVCLVLFFYCWRIRKIRYRLTGSVQVSALPTAADSTTVPPAVEQTGIKKEVIATFPTVKAHELKDGIKEGCPICLVEYADAEVLRKLPLCGHVFHIRCVDSWLENQGTCPVCRILLTSTRTSSKAALHPAAGAAATVGLPAWVLVNRPMPLPPAISTDPCPALQTSSEPQQHMDLCMSPLLVQCRSAAGWGAVYRETHAHRLSFASTPPPPQPQRQQQAIQVQSKQCIHHASISERWMTESFVFGVSTFGSDADHSPCRGDRKRLSPWQQQDDVLESRVKPFRPLALTMSPERCSFEFLPIVTTSESTSSRSHTPRVPWLAAPSRHSFYSQL